MAPKRGRRDDDTPAAPASTTSATSTGAPTTHAAADAPASPTKARPKKPARTRKRWLPEEEAALYAGVQKHGVGAWAIILATNPDAFDAQRTPIDLKDKWRVLTTRRNAAAPPPPIDLTHLPRATVTRLRQAGITKRPRDPSPDRLARTEPVAVAPPTDLPARVRATVETEVTDDVELIMDASGNADVPVAPLAPFVKALAPAVPAIQLPAPSAAPFPAPPVAPNSAVPANPFAALTATTGFGVTPGFLPFDDLATANLLDSLLQASAAPSLPAPPGPVAVPLSMGSSSSPSTSSSSAPSLAPAPTPPMLPWAAPSLASLGLLEELPLPPPPRRVAAAFPPAPPVYQFGMLAPLAPSPQTAGYGDPTWVPRLTPPASTSSASSPPTSSRSRATPGPVTIVHGCIPIVVPSPPIMADGSGDHHHHHDMLADLIAAASPTLRNDPVFMDDGDGEGSADLDDDGPVSRDDPNFYDYDAENGDPAASNHDSVQHSGDDGEEGEWPDLAALPSLFPDDEAHERHVTEQRVREAIESGKHISKKQVKKMYVKLQKMHGVPKSEVVGLPPFKRCGRGSSRSRSRSGSRPRHAHGGDAHMAGRDDDRCHHGQERRELDRVDDAEAPVHPEDDGGEPRGHAQCFHHDCYGRDTDDPHGPNHCRRYDSYHHEVDDDAHPHPHSHGDDGDHARRRQWYHHNHHPHDHNPPVPSDFFNTRHHPAPALAPPGEPILLRIFERRHADIIAKLKRKKAKCDRAAAETEVEAAAAAAPPESAPQPAAPDAVPAAGEVHVLELADMLDAVLQLDPETRDKSLEQIATRGFTKNHKQHHMRHMQHHGDPEARQRMFARKHPHAELVGGYGFGFGGISDDEEGEDRSKTPQYQQPWDEVLGMFKAADQVVRERGAPAAKGPITAGVVEKPSSVDMDVDTDRGRHHDCRCHHGERGHSRHHSRRRERAGASDE